MRMDEDEGQKPGFVCLHSEDVTSHLPRIMIRFVPSPSQTSIDPSLSFLPLFSKTGCCPDLRNIAISPNTGQLPIQMCLP
jgi:hypothetical protein